MARDYQLQQPERKGTSGIDYKAALNEEQYAAVTSPPGAALVIAGAGSGKTRTLDLSGGLFVRPRREPEGYLASDLHQ